MTRRVRLALFGLGAFGLAGLLAWGVAGLPDFGHYPGPYGDVLSRVAVGERHASNVVAAVVFDYRALDTMGEELILFCAVMGVALLLREHREEQVARHEHRVRSDALRLFGLGMVGPTLLLALLVIAYGYITPGGGFQGGVVAAAALALVWGAGSYRAYHQLSPESLVDFAEGVAAGGFVAIGVAGLVSAGTMFENFLPLGTIGTLLSAGQIPLLNWAAGLEVAAAMTLLFAHFLEDVMIPESAP